MLPLFGDEDSARARLAQKLKDLAGQGVFIGASSWKYEGWIGQIYSEERYQTRGRFSRKRFEAECLAEYAEVFPTVCGDFSFYQFPSEAYWSRLFGSAPRSLRFAFKAPEEITVKTFPTHARYGARAGKENPSFLDAGLFEKAFLEMLRPWQPQVAALIFEFGSFSRKAMASLDDFLQRLDPFLAALPGEWRYAVEIRNAEFLQPEYFGSLRGHGVAHVLNSWSRMPELAAQTAIPGAFPADFTVVRALLRQGRYYQHAVEKFAPYKTIQDPNPEARAALRQIIARARQLRQEAYIYVNNRLEGNAPGTIEAILE
jgi:uncharacterized protein YecE (DUF72 family)